MAGDKIQQGEYASLTKAGVPQEWIDANPNTPPSAIAKAWLIYNSKQPDIVGRFNQNVQAGVDQVWGDTDHPMKRVHKAIVQGVLPESIGGAVADTVMAALPVPTRSAGVGGRLLMGEFTERGLPRSVGALGRAAIGTGVAAGTDVALGADADDASKRALINQGLGGLFGGAVGEGASYARRNVARQGTREIDMREFGRSVSPWIPNEGTAESLWRNVYGRQAADYQGAVLDSLERTFTRPLGGKAGRVNSIEIPGLENIVAEGRLATLHLPGGPTGSRPVHFASVQDFLDGMRLVKERIRALRSSKEPMRAAELDDLAKGTEQSFMAAIQQRGRPEDVQAYVGFLEFAREKEILMRFLKDSGLGEKGSSGMKLSLNMVRDTLDDFARTGRKTAYLEQLERAGLYEMLNVLQRRTGPLSGMDVRHGPLSFASFGIPGKPGRLSVGSIPGTSVTSHVGEVPGRGGMYPRVLAPLGAETLSGLNEVLE